MKLFENLFKTKEMTCADELNILDIEGNIFYSLDNYLSLYIKVSPIAFEYLSNIEKKRIIQRLNSELAGEKETIKIIVMSLSISTKEISEYLNNIRSNTKNSFKRNVLLREIKEIENLSYNGEMIEKIVVVQLFKKNDDGAKENLEKRGKEFVLKLQNAGISSYILDKREILQFFNSFLNMKFRHDNFSDIWSDDFD